MPVRNWNNFVFSQKNLSFRFFFVAVTHDSFAHVAIELKDIFLTIGCGDYARLWLSSSVGKRQQLVEGVLRKKLKKKNHSLREETITRVNEVEMQSNIS